MEILQGIYQSFQENRIQKTDNIQFEESVSGCPLDNCQIGWCQYYDIYRMSSHTKDFKWKMFSSHLGAQHERYEFKGNHRVNL